MWALVLNCGRHTKSSTDKQFWRRHDYDFNTHLFPKPTTPENKSQNPGAFLHPEKLTAKTPRLPRIPPRSHHQKTTSKHSLSAKYPAKTPKLPSQKK
jgi:hypothetical protein